MSANFQVRIQTDAAWCKEDARLLVRGVEQFYGTRGQNAGGENIGSAPLLERDIHALRAPGTGCMSSGALWWCSARGKRHGQCVPFHEADSAKQAS